MPGALDEYIHLGADRLLIIGVRARRAAGVAVNRAATAMPTPGAIFGYMLDTLFTDQIYGDLEQLERMNELVRWKETIVTKLSTGVATLCKRAKVRVIPGWARFTDAKTCTVERRSLSITCS